MTWSSIVIHSSSTILFCTTTNVQLETTPIFQRYVDSLYFFNTKNLQPQCINITVDALFSVLRSICYWRIAQNDSHGSSVSVAASAVDSVGGASICFLLRRDNRVEVVGANSSSLRLE